MNKLRYKGHHGGRGEAQGISIPVSEEGLARKRYSQGVDLGSKKPDCGSRPAMLKFIRKYACGCCCCNDR